jgi:preprotein translocase subunit YajC
MKEHADLVRSLEPGDDVLTNGGLYGTIATIDGQIAELEIADGVVVRIQRSAVAELIEWDDGTEANRYDEEG